MVRHARAVGGPALRTLTFHQRVDLLKRLGTYLSANKDVLFTLAAETGATRRDNMIDIDGGIATLLAYASRGQRELPSERFVIEGASESLSKGGSFVGQHALIPLQGGAVHINAFNFPCWGTLEKLAPALLAGMPVRSSTTTCARFVKSRRKRKAPTGQQHCRINSPEGV